MLYDKKTGTHLLQWPVEEIESLRVGDPTVKQVDLQPGSIELLRVDSAAEVCCVTFVLNYKHALNLQSQNLFSYCAVGYRSLI